MTGKDTELETEDLPIMIGIKTPTVTLWAGSQLRPLNADGKCMPLQLLPKFVVFVCAEDRYSNSMQGTCQSVLLLMA